MGMRHMDAACGQFIPIAGCGGGPDASPMLIGCSASSPGVYSAFDPSTLSSQEYFFTDELKIDFASPSMSLDTDGVTHIGEGGPRAYYCTPIHNLFLL